MISRRLPRLAVVDILLLVGFNAFCNFVRTTLLFVFFSTSIYR